MKKTIISLAMVLALMAASTVQVALSETQDFLVEPADWTGWMNQSFPDGTAYGWSDTNNAGGDAGEAGGRFPQATDKFT